MRVDGAFGLGGSFVIIGKVNADVAVRKGTLRAKRGREGRDRSGGACYGNVKGALYRRGAVAYRAERDDGDDHRREGTAGEGCNDTTRHGLTILAGVVRL
jgi:hypothetical protein